MRRNIILIAVIISLVAADVLWLMMKPAATSVRSDLVVTFVGMTNDPVETMSPVRVCVIHGVGDQYALFTVKNSNPGRFIHFDTVCVETNDGREWGRFEPSGSWGGVGGSVWEPGYSCLYAIAWPPGLDTNAVWRMRLVSHRELNNWRLWVNYHAHLKIFSEGQGETNVSSEVRP